VTEFSRFVQFWNKNGPRINEERRTKYATDAERREAQRKAAKERYVPKGPNRRGPNKPKTIIVGDVTATVIGLGEAARRLGMTKGTLRGYDDRGVIPANSHVDSEGRRWYPEAYVDFLAPLLADQGRRREPLWRLKARVEDAWKAAAPTIPRLPQETTHDAAKREDRGSDDDSGAPGGVHGEGDLGDESSDSDERTF
jgi:hypothetical protein